MKIAVGIIAFNSMPFLEGVLHTMYPFASQIFVVEGPVTYWRLQGHEVSSDGTVEMVRGFPDPVGKIQFFQGQWEEKDEQHDVYMSHIDDDIDYLWICDPDELYRQDDVATVLGILEEDRYDSIGFQCYEFVHSLDTCVVSSMVRPRVLRWGPGTRLVTSRPPTIAGTKRRLAGKVLARDYGVRLYHYGHVYDFQIERRAEYYRHRHGGFSLEWLRDSVQFEGTHPQWVEDNRDRLARWEP